VVFSAF